MTDARLKESENEIDATALGDTLHPARPEIVALVIYVVALGGFLTWLLVFGVNV